MHEPAVRGRRRGGRWTKVGHGLYVPAGDDGPPLAAWHLALPSSGAFTGLTAAGLHGLWLPPLPVGTPTFVAVRDGGTAPRRPGLRVVRQTSAIPTVAVRGLPTVPVPEAILGCARDLGLLDVVVLVDAALHKELCSMDDVACVAALRRRGAPLLREALRLADGRSESPYESLLRLLHAVCEVPVEAQHEVFHDGRFVARGDLWLVGTRTLHEYDGAHHLTRAQQRRDLRRGRGLDEASWHRRGYVLEDLLHQGLMILRDADAALGRPHQPDRIRAWEALLVDSAFSVPGRHRLLRRWRS